ncbi:MAG: AIR synthase-related protein, partial [Candidatus Dormibacteria bacterium]
EIMWQLEEAVAGLAEAARALEIPVVSGNVSLYNQFDGRGIPPTPTLGLVGRVPQLGHPLGPGFRAAGDLVALAGPPGAGPEGVELGASEYQRLAHGTLEGAIPELDLGQEARTAGAVRQAVRLELLRSAHDCSLGGLGVALAESAVKGGLGARILPPLALPREPAPGWLCGLLFGETQGRYLLSLRPEKLEEVEALFLSRGAPFRRLGVVGGQDLVVEGVVLLSLERARLAWEGALARLMEPKR